MKTSVSLALLCAVLLILSSCKGSETQPTFINFKTGYDGLSMQLLPQYPPRTVFEGGSTSIAVRVQNRGAYTLENGRLAVIGLNQVASPLVEDEQLMDFKRKNYLSLQARVNTEQNSSCSLNTIMKAQ